MQTQNPFLDEFAKLTTAAMGLAQSAGEEAKAAFRAQAERFVVEFDLVRRDEFDAMKAQLQALREEIAELKANAGAQNAGDQGAPDEKSARA
jgi:BMFP domain-containing protein YqiC